MKAAKLASFDYIETFYNSQRMHSPLNYHCPNDILDFHFPNHQNHLN